MDLALPIEGSENQGLVWGCCVFYIDTQLKKIVIHLIFNQIVSNCECQGEHA
jgi:hypothetical protein